MRRLLVVLGTAITAILLIATPALAQEPGSVTINSAVLISPFQMRVTGTIECVEGSQYQVSVFVRQQGPQQTIVNGFGGFGGVSCATTGAQAWTTTANAESRKFNPGITFVQVGGQVCSPPDFIDCSSRQVELTLKVNRDRG